MSTHSYAGDITIDGQTATSVSALPGGALKVDIAPANSKGHSRNTYKDFNVPKAGVQLNNRTAKAGLILNEVTSSNKSLIQGAVQITGPKADVVIANPNGITVNGGSFVNTGNGLLVTGVRNGSTASGEPVYTVTGNEIVIGPDGLATTIDQLTIHAGKLRINGDVDVGESELNLGTGTGKITVGLGDLSGWSEFTPDNEPGLSMHISSGVMLSGGVISMRATGAGAGINMSGAGLASSGEYTITSSGQIIINGNIKAKNTLLIDGNSVAITGTSARKVELESTAEAVQIVTQGPATVKHALLKGAGKGFAGFSTDAAVSLRSKGDLSVQNSTSSTLTGRVEFISEESVELSNNVLNSVEDIVVLSSDQLVLTDNIIKADQAVNLRSTESTVRIIRSQTDGDLGVTVVGDTVRLVSSDTERTILNAETGGVSIRAEGSVYNLGALVTGAKKTEGEDDSLGGVTVRAGGDIRNTTVSQTSLASFFATSSALIVEADGSLINESGRLLSNSDAVLSAGQRIENSILQSGEEIAGIPARSDTSGNFGSYMVGAEIGQITIGNDLTIKSSYFGNLGGDVAAENIQMDVLDFENRPERLGVFQKRSRCVFFICRHKVRSSLSHDGGNINASEQMQVNASGSILNYGGQLRGGSGIKLAAPNIRFNANLYPDVFSRPSGIRGLFHGSQPRVYLTYSNGVLFSEAGNIEFESSSSAEIVGTEVFASEGVVSTNGHDIVDVPVILTKRNYRSLGLFGWLLK